MLEYNTYIFNNVENYIQAFNTRSLTEDSIVKILNRNVSIVDIPQRIIMMLFLISRTCILFKRPLRLLVSYIRNTPFLEQFVEFRNGKKSKTNF